jgi:hypothetical protein
MIPTLIRAEKNQKKSGIKNSGITVKEVHDE